MNTKNLSEAQLFEYEGLYQRRLDMDTTTNSQKDELQTKLRNIRNELNKRDRSTHEY